MIKTYLFTESGVTQDISLDDWKANPPEGCALLWVDVRSFTDEELKHLAEVFNLHPVELESCADPYHRPHLSEFQDHFHVNLTMVKSGGNHGIAKSELHLFVGKNYIITLTKEKETKAVDDAMKSFINTPALCCKGPMYAVYLLSEDLVESYFPIVEKLDDDADRMENTMLDNPDRESLRKLFSMKRRAFELRRLLGPQRDIFNELARRDFPFITGENQIYFQDVYNRMIRVFDMLDTIREIQSGSLDIYLSMVSNRLNAVMKVLTVVATVLMTLSFITGFYGMNFVYLPWLRSPNAFRNISIFMVALIIAMLYWSKRKDWL
jgi:magnesium transporter